MAQGIRRERNEDMRLANCGTFGCRKHGAFKVFDNDGLTGFFCSPHSLGQVEQLRDEATREEN